MARFRAAAPATIARARGCSLCCSTLAAKRRRSVSLIDPTGRHSVSVGRPAVSVPVLSTTTVSTFSSRSSTSAFFTSTPSRAPRPMPTMIDIGVASPSAQGQAMISTATALTSAQASGGCSGAAIAHTKNVMTAIASTAGTK